jgi:rare lipoprotein A (peptidoglycan hydrolase)
MRRNSVFVFIFYVAILCIPQYTAAQTSAPDVWRDEGVASWYGTEFDGRPTASGEIFNSALFTAAHPSLPFGTFLKVTNKQNNRWVTVKVNDRGPFVASRIIDVSKAAAEHLDMISAGTVPVIIETLSGSYASPPRTQAAAPTPAAPPPPPPAISQVPAAAPEPPPPPAYTQAPPPPAYTQAPPPAYTQAPPPPPAYTQAPPLPAYTPPSAPPPVYTPPPAAAPEPVPPAVEYNYIPYAPMVYSPFYIQPPQPVQSPYPAVTAFPPPPVPPVFESVPPSQLSPLSESLPLPPPQAPPPPEITQPSGSGIKLIPALNPVPDKKYRLQVGSYKIPRNAVEVFSKLKAAGLNPAYEQNGELYRVMLTGIRGTEVQSVADKLEKAGFREAIIREEN